MDNEIKPPILEFTGHRSTKATLKQFNWLPSPGFTCKYDQDGDYIAVGCNGGQKIIYSLSDSKSHILENRTQTTQTQNEAGQPSVTCIRWRPNSHSKVVIFCLSNGVFQYYHLPSMKKLFTVQQPGNSILCCDFEKSGQILATSGSDGNIRIYDQNTKSIRTILSKAEWNKSGHSNRVFSVKFLDENTLISGGWDSVIHVWDIRTAKSAKSFYGPHIAGDSMDLKQNTLLTGCYSSKNQIQLWDIRNFQRIKAISWDCNKNEVAYVYSARFGNSKKQENNWILAGASGVNEVKIFTGEQHESCLTVTNLNGGCFSTDSSSTSANICFITAKNGMYICNFP